MTQLRTTNYAMKRVSRFYYNAPYNRNEKREKITFECKPFTQLFVIRFPFKPTALPL